MNPMSALANYLETIRVEKNITLEESARRSNMTPETYRQREKQPEKVPLYMLASMMNALDMKGEEFVEFSVLTSQHLWD
ncbi:MAG: helix-turn-helix transcriptional regulator [Bdellovibrionales bacterium]|nr:helix-turn-helix transcriptional regulator [Bdellovibrionales bacterium]